MAVALHPSQRLKHLRLAEFSHMNSYWDPIQNVEVVRILAGEYYATHCDEMITTVLGSCVSACIRDPIAGIGGMNHFMLPNETASGGSPEYRNLSADTAYGSYAMEQLINCLLKYGGRRENLEVKIFGGGRILGGMTDIGLQNIEFVRTYLRTEGLTIVAEDVGDDFPRRIAYLPMIGKVWVKKLRNIRNETIIKQDAAYCGEIRQQTARGSEIELFGDSDNGNR